MYYAELYDRDGYLQRYHVISVTVILLRILNYTLMNVVNSEA